MANDQNLKVLATKEDLAKLEGKLTTAIEASRADMIKWMFTFVSGALIINIIAIIGALFMLANIMKR